MPCALGEWGLGDLAYGGCERMLCGCKAPTSINQAPVDHFSKYWTSLVAFYRARVEIVIARLKRDAWCQQVFRGSFELLVALSEVTVVMTAMQMKREFDQGKCMFEVVGPWPHRF
jgi:hypothetical protein